LAADLLNRRPFDQGGQEQAHLLQNVVNEMSALEIFAAVVPQYGKRWEDPANAELALARALRLAPENHLLLTAAAESELQMDRPVKALELVSQALARAPEYAKAHDIKGTVLLRQRLPSLAVESFSRAGVLSPRNPDYLRHRASAYLVLEEQALMCADLKDACGLGECGELKWAQGAGLCAEGAVPEDAHQSGAGRNETGGTDR
jgi:tetratricopeptide (TPR) repeat protein